MCTGTYRPFFPGPEPLISSNVFLLFLQYFDREQLDVHEEKLFTVLDFV